MSGWCTLFDLQNNDRTRSLKRSTEAQSEYLGIPFKHNDRTRSLKRLVALDAGQGRVCLLLK